MVVVGLGRACQPGQCPRSFCRLCRLPGQACQAGAVLGAEHDELAAQTREPTCSCPVACVLLQRHVEIRPAEAEGADRGAPWMLRAPDPRPRDWIQVEGTALEPQLRVGSSDLQGGWQHLVMDGHHGLEEAGGAGRCLGMTDLGLDRSKGAPLSILSAALVEYRLQTFELGGVAGFGPGAVSLDQLDCSRAEAGLFVGPPQRPGLTFRYRCVDALGTPVGRGADTTDDCVDLIAVALGIGEPFESDHAESFAKQGSVCLVRERPAIAGEAHGLSLAETHEHEDVVEGIDPSGNDHVRVADLQLADSHGQGRERGGAGGVGDAVCAAEIETVRDAPGHDIAQEARKGALLPRYVAVADAIADGLHLVLRHAGLPQGLDPDRALEPRHHGPEQLLGRGDAEDYGDAGTIHGLELAA